MNPHNDQHAHFCREAHQQQGYNLEEYSDILSCCRGEKGELDFAWKTANTFGDILKGIIKANLLDFEPGVQVIGSYTMWDETNLEMTDEQFKLVQRLFKEVQEENVQT